MQAVSYTQIYAFLYSALEMCSHSLGLVNAAYGWSQPCHMLHICFKNWKSIALASAVLSYAAFV
jgi:hypothetical protein